MKCDAAPSDIFSEGVSYSLLGGHNKPLLSMGTVSPSLTRRFGIKQPVFAAEINWNTLFEVIKRNKVSFKEMPKFPEVRRDLAIVVDEEVKFSDIRKAAFQSEKNFLKQVALFDVFRDKKLGEGKKQYAISFVFQDPEKTLVDEATERMVAKLLKTFESKFSAVLR